MIHRKHISHRMSQIVEHGGLVYIAGQVAERFPGASVHDQTRDVCQRIDELLAEAGTDNSRILSAQIWLSDMRHYDSMNEVWDSWLPVECAPARACVESRLAYRQFDVEIMVIAAK